jgi:hypothetical protein
MSAQRPLLLLAVFVVAACGSSPAPAPAKPVEPLPADPVAARTELALRFVRAVSDRDRARMDALVDPRGFCEAGMKRQEPARFTSVDECAAEMGKVNPQAFDAYEQGIPAGSEVGTTDEYALDAEQGFYQINVHVDGAPEGLVGVFVAELEGHPYLVFPVKKDE